MLEGHGVKGDVVTAIIDCDQHLYESRTLWRDHFDPALRDEALRIEDDELGYPWITLARHAPRHGRRADSRARPRCSVSGATAAWPGDPPDVLVRRGAPARLLGPDRARSAASARWGSTRRCCFPNFGLLWERRLSGSLPALLTNMGAWNRWCSTVVADGGGALHPVAHLSLRDLDWLDAQLRRASPRAACTSR